MNEYQQYYGAQQLAPQLAQQLAAQQLAQQQGLQPQGFFGGLIGAPLGGLIGRGIGGLFGNSNLGNQIGQIAGGIGGSILPFSADPVAAAYAQQAQQQQLQQLQQGQLAPQGWFGNLIGSVAQPLGGAIGGLFGNAGIGNTIGGVAGQLGRLLPFSVDPVTAAYAQQAEQQQQAQQMQQQLQQMQQLQQLQQAQQGQLAPQGWFGNLIGSVAQPLGGALGGLFGNSGIGSTIGGVAGQLGRMLPFSVDPVTAAYAQQIAQQQQQLAQLAQQQAQLGQLAQAAQQNSGYYPGYQAGQAANVYGGQQTLH